MHPSRLCVRWRDRNRAALLLQSLKPRRWPMRWDRNNVRPGMFVTRPDGEKIGKVIRCGAETFVVEKGVLFPKDYELRYDHITDVRGENLSYALTEAIRREGRAPAAAEATKFTAASAAAAAKPEPATPL